MLTRTFLPGRLAGGNRASGRQAGVVLIIALIVLVAMSLAAIALVRSIDTTNIIVGNLGFKQAATQSGDTGIESATAWLERNNNAALNNNLAANGYFASRVDPTAGQSWDAFWTATLAAQAVTLAPDAAGNTVSYVIHRLCNQAGSRDPNVNPGISCSVSPVAAGNDCVEAGCGQNKLNAAAQLYYRITARVAGPRNTVSYVQAVVTL